MLILANQGSACTCCTVCRPQRVCRDTAVVLAELAAAALLHRRLRGRLRRPAAPPPPRPRWAAEHGRLAVHCHLLVLLLLLQLLDLHRHLAAQQAERTVLLRLLQRPPLLQLARRKDPLEIVGELPVRH